MSNPRSIDDIRRDDPDDAHYNRLRLAADIRLNRALREADLRQELLNIGRRDLTRTIILSIMPTVTETFAERFMRWETIPYSFQLLENRLLGVNSRVTTNLQKRFRGKKVRKQIDLTSDGKKIEVLQAPPGTIVQMPDGRIVTTKGYFYDIALKRWIRDTQANREERVKRTLMHDFTGKRISRRVSEGPKPVTPKSKQQGHFFKIHTN